MNLKTNSILPAKHDAFIVGYYGMKNSGDDALMYASQMYAKNSLGCNTTAVTSTSERLHQFKPSTVCKIRRPQRFKGQNKISQYIQAFNSKMVIFGGGSVLHSYADISEKINLVKLTEYKQGIAIGVGIGPFENVAAEYACKKFLEMCSFVGVRDKRSLELAKRLAPKANVRLTFDLAPLLTLSPEFNIEPQKREGIAINICPIPTNSMGKVDEEEQELTIEKWCSIILRIWLETKQPISLFSLNGHSLLGDEFICQKIWARLSSEIPLEHITYNSNPFLMMKKIASFKLIMSMRLHGCIFGFLTNTPVIAINYHNKGVQWCNQVGMPSDYIFEAKKLDSEALIHSVREGLDAGFQPNTMSVQQAVQYAKKNGSESYEIRQSFRRNSFV